MLWIILISFLVGMFLGMKGKLLFIKRYKPVTYITVLLLFFMGFEIGSDQDLISKLSEIGYLSLYIALFSIAGSMILTTIYEKFFRGNSK
ncbi:membrane protein [Marinitoga sp. 1197]|uniref:LysO family transporter n=1 Tax=Marinitoga sp. 1197 TaxID=1428449 RepID=UPI00065956AD|nr:LysO family transporter [Marinitoga sp. 1197]KLO21997.1 membrane protein [Marinitoga sp. 1197]